MKKYFFRYVIVFLVCTYILLPSKTFANWAYQFVVWDGYVYVITDEVVNEVKRQIGHVTKYSDMEGTYTGNFSNVYPKGTKYYSILGVDTDEAIAVEDESGHYIMANRNGEYAGSKKDVLRVDSPTLIVGVLTLATLCIYFISKRRNENGK